MIRKNTKKRRKEIFQFLIQKKIKFLLKGKGSEVKIKKVIEKKQKYTQKYKLTKLLKDKILKEPTKRKYKIKLINIREEH